MSAFERIESFIGQIKEYINVRIEIIKLQTAASTSKVLSNLVAMLMVSFIMMLFLCFAGIAASLAISAWLGPLYSGFLIMSVLFLIAAIIVWKKRESLLRIPIMNSILRQLSSSDEDNKK
jgi:hypothetical protein